MGKRHKSNGKANKEPTGQFGIAASDVHQLRRDIRAAVEIHGENVVLEKLGYTTIKDACEELHIDMSRPGFGSVKNALKGLAGPRVHRNKYAEDSQAPDRDTLG